ncbi:MAG: 2-hydroxy-3-keto-5-methylthiopentenyl-phosphate phosphatase [Gaiellales bacterium]|jgi:HAD superfamily phosphoserine phosphatase-like hydrolase|nr:2-hydroxy-3-keto-5-methylthiopentenyl-phosphate phosphatase [Gaiellales bacterium]
MLIVVDFDGTITQQDTLVAICRRHAPEVFSQVERDLDAGEISLYECIRREFEAIRGDHGALIAEAVGLTEVRPGFAEFVDAAKGAGHRLVVVSSGFEAIIRPVLEREGVGGLQLVANQVRFSPERTVVEFRHGEACDVCSQECKRSSVRDLNGSGQVVMIGDGYSDRCVAMSVDRVFARRSLARYLERESVPFEPFEDFFDIRRGLGL